jgi:hypothetical protein
MDWKVCDAQKRIRTARIPRNAGAHILDAVVAKYDNFPLKACYSSVVKKPKFVNVVQYSELYPSFEIHPHFDRVSLSPGDVAKVCIQFEEV